jgi:hypothetical protein
MTSTRLVLSDEAWQEIAAVLEQIKHRTGRKTSSTE